MVAWHAVHIGICGVSDVRWHEGCRGYTFVGSLVGLSAGKSSCGTEGTSGYSH